MIHNLLYVYIFTNHVFTQVCIILVAHWLCDPKQWPDFLIRDPLEIKCGSLTTSEWHYA